MLQPRQERHPVVEINHLTKSYGSVVALNNVSLRIEEGEFVALLGPSGCGKTTLLRTIAGFLEPNEGEILIDGHKVVGKPPNHRPVNTVFQNYALFPHYTIFENVAFGPRRQGLDAKIVKQRVTEALAVVGMETFAKRYPIQLSGGQQQRIALARAIVNRPKVLLLDEPLGALDLQLRRRMQIELKRLHEHLNITFLLVTHDQDEAMSMADRIAVMNAGEIIQCGSGAEIYNKPNSRFVAEFIGEANILHCEVIDGKLRLEGEQHDLPYACDHTAKSDILLLVRPENIGIGESTTNQSLVQIEVTVRHKVLLSGVVKVYASTTQGKEIVINTTQRQDLSWLSIGAKVIAHWRAEDGKVLVQ